MEICPKSRGGPGGPRGPPGTGGHQFPSGERTYEGGRWGFLWVIFVSGERENPPDFSGDASPQPLVFSEDLENTPLAQPSAAPPGRFAPRGGGYFQGPLKIPGGSGEASPEKSGGISRSPETKMTQRKPPATAFPNCLICLGKLEHTWANPRYGRKSVRFRSPDLPPGRIFMKRTRGIRFGGSRGLGEPNWVILGWVVGDPCML